MNLTAASLETAFAVLTLLERAGISWLQFKSFRESGVTDEQLLAALEKTADVLQQHRDLDLRRGLPE